MTIHSRPSRLGPRIDENQLREWLATAKVGEVIEYHRGFLAIDRLVHRSRLDDDDGRQLDRVANILVTLATTSRGHLLQRRHGDGDYSYIFVLTPPVLGDRQAWLATLEKQP